MNVKKKREILRELARDPRLRSVNTQQSYLREVQAFEKWREERSISKELVEEYLIGQKSVGKSPGTVLRIYYALRWWLRKQTETPDGELTIQKAELIIERAEEVVYIRDLSSEPSSQDDQISKGELWRIIKVCLSDPTPAGKRDAAVILLANKSDIRLEEITGLDLADFVVEGDQEGQLVVRGSMDLIKTIHIDNFTYCALLDWLAVRGTRPGPLFCGVDNRGKIIHRYLSCSTMRLVLIKRLKQATVRHLTWSELRQS